MKVFVERVANLTFGVIYIVATFPATHLYNSINQWKPLQKAAEFGRAKVIKMLLVAGANTEAVCIDRWKALHVSAMLSQDAARKAANIEAADRNGWSPFNRPSHLFI